MVELIRGRLGSAEIEFFQFVNSHAPVFRRGVGINEVVTEII